MRITIKNHPVTMNKTLRKEGKNTAEPERLFFIASANFNFLIANARTCKGVPLVDLFFAFFERI